MYGTYLVECFRIGDIENVIRQLEHHRVIWWTMVAIPFPNIHGDKVGTQYAFLYQHTEELGIEVQT
jgi:hypothetical protein